MPFPPLLAIAQQLSTADIKRLPALKRSLPKIGRLEARRKRIISELAAVDSQLAILAGEDEPAIKKRGGRKPAAKGKPGRKPAAKEQLGSQGRRKSKDAQPRKAKINREAMLERLAKARKVLAAKRKAEAKAAEAKNMNRRGLSSDRPSTTS